MKNKKILIGACSLLMCATMVGCKKEVTLQKIVAELSEKEKVYKEGDTINKDDIVVHGYYSNNETQLITDWTCDTLKDNKYTFTSSDIGEKQFTIKFADKETELKVTVDDKLHKTNSLEYTSRIMILSKVPH